MEHGREVLDTCIMDSKSSRSLAVLSVAQMVVFEHVASDMCAKDSGNHERLSMAAVARLQKDILDMGMMDFKTVRSLTDLSTARMIDTEYLAEDISIRDPYGSWPSPISLDDIQK
jgi:hypothetical protein